MNNTNPSPEHQALVSALLVHLRGKLGHKVIAAALENYEAPESQGRHEPDLLTIDQNGLLHIGEAKVGQDIYSSHTQEQIEDFSDLVMTNSRQPVPFHLIVYEKDKDDLDYVLGKLNLDQLVGDRITVWTV